MHNHTYHDLYNYGPLCFHCNIEETIIYLRGILSTSYDPDQRIVGDLEKLVWVVVCGVRVTPPTYESIMDNHTMELGIQLKFNVATGK